MRIDKNHNWQASQASEPGFVTNSIEYIQKIQEGMKEHAL